jgi:hypothetical protein
MTATNHALTGAAIGLISGNPWLALPGALASHFICDSLPHFGFPERHKVLKTSIFRNYLIAEAGICFTIVFLLFALHPEHWLLAAVCAFVAASPDFLWIQKFTQARKNRKWRPSAYAKFASGIQWFQRPVGALVELAWFVALVLIIAPFLHH